MWEYNAETGVEVINGVEFTPVKTVGGSPKGFTHYGYIDPRDRTYKVCAMGEAAGIAHEIAATQLPAPSQEVIDIG